VNLLSQLDKGGSAFVHSDPNRSLPARGVVMMVMMVVVVTNDHHGSLRLRRKRCSKAKYEGKSEQNPFHV
jgi:hypothetical protein